MEFSIEVYKTSNAEKAVQRHDIDLTQLHLAVKKVVWKLLVA